MQGLGADRVIVVVLLGQRIVASEMIHICEDEVKNQRMDALVEVIACVMELWECWLEDIIKRSL